ncbi:MAG: isocitrate lyase/PEP mutase family protein [Rhodospirillales bacterium]|nr:isocitrate lyase/PEP mutase family protein [Rhodospirillales bacterium]
MRAVLAGEGCVRPASVFDAGSARIAASLGFETAMLAGSIASLAVLGAPDLILLTLTELSDLALRISRAADLPLIVDADHGYGNALNVQRTIEELEFAGVAVITIEDTQLPRRFNEAKPELVLVEEGIGKMRAALAARRDPSLVIAGRTTVSAAGVAGAIARAQAYRRAGVDAIFFAGLRTSEELETIAAAVPPPILLGGTPPGLADHEALARRGVRVALQPHLSFSAAMAAVFVTLKALREGTPPPAIGGTAPPALMRMIACEDDYRAATAAFLASSGS